MDRASATETVDLGSILGRIEPTTIKPISKEASLLDVSTLNRTRVVRQTGIFGLGLGLKLTKISGLIRA